MGKIHDEDARKLFDWLIENTQREGGEVLERGELSGVGGGEWALLSIPRLTQRLLELVPAEDKGARFMIVAFQPKVEWRGSFHRTTDDLYRRDVQLIRLDDCEMYEDALELLMTDEGTLP